MKTHRMLVAAVLLVASIPALSAPPMCGKMPMDQVDEMDFNVYFPTEAQAIEAAAQIDDAVFDIVVRTSATGEDWLLRAVYRELPAPDAHAMHANAVATAAKSHGGQYSGAACASQLHGRDAGT